MNTDFAALPTRYWSRIGSDRVQCDVCPRHCRLHEGQRGLCFVRGRDRSGVELYTYGRSSGFCIDPIEKKPLHHFLPGSAVLSFGTAGCNLSCKFCQNWDMSKSREMDTLADAAMPQDIAAAAQRHGCSAVAFTYNDPTVFLEYAIDVAQACRESGVRSVAVTAGYICEEPRAEFYRWIDAANVDLKAFTERFYRNICGSELAPVLDTLVYLRRETQVWLEITTLLIPGENDSDAELDSMTRWIAGTLGLDVPLHFTAFHPDWKMLGHRPTPPATLSRARSIAIRNGLRYVYTGNVRDVPGGSTWCPACGGLLVERDGYNIGRWGLAEGGSCARCGERIAGVFEARPGGWGARRMPIRMASSEPRQDRSSP